jgi:hypothetical protein
MISSQSISTPHWYLGDHSPHLHPYCLHLDPGVPTLCRLVWWLQGQQGLQSPRIDSGRLDCPWKSEHKLKVFAFTTVTSTRYEFEFWREGSRCYVPNWIHFLNRNISSHSGSG